MRRIKNVSSQNPLAIQLDTFNKHTGERESIYLKRQEERDLTKAQFKSGHVKKFKSKGFIIEVPIPAQVIEEEPVNEPVVIADNDE